MTETNIAAYVDATAELIGLPLHPDHRPGVLRYFALAASMAEALSAAPVGVEVEGADVFLPVSSGANE